MAKPNRLADTKNEYGTPVGNFICSTCGVPFSLTPAPPPSLQWDDCGAIECASYDEIRDASKWFDGGIVAVRPDGQLVPMKVIEGGNEQPALGRGEG